MHVRDADVGHNADLSLLSVLSPMSSVVTGVFKTVSSSLQLCAHVFLGPHNADGQVRGQVCGLRAAVPPREGGPGMRGGLLHRGVIGRRREPRRHSGTDRLAGVGLVLGDMSRILT